MIHELRRLFDLTGRRGIVIGAGSGIGEAVSLGLAAFGAEVTCADLDGKTAARTADLIVDAGAVARPMAVDVLDPESVDHLLSVTGAPDILVVTPGINVRKRLMDLTDEEADRVISLNIGGTLRAVRETAKLMADTGRGSIIVLSSIRALVIEPGQGIYAATKAGAVQLVRTFAAELGSSGIRVNAVAPGVVDTPLTQPIAADPAWYEAYAAKTILGRWARPSEMVGAVVFLASDAASYVTGSVLYVDGGWTAADGRYTPPT